ncbi:hypothetical protein AB0J57_03830 [Streptomyces sp. NPDC049837]|uniref:hypothetical protein n=1 Tax=Streptomyces sp. NPDC049837 TaxID=3155277 RepID=UPI003447053A
MPNSRLATHHRTAAPPAVHELAGPVGVLLAGPAGPAQPPAPAASPLATGPTGPC